MLLPAAVQDLPAVVHQLLMMSTRGCRELILQVRLEGAENCSTDVLLMQWSVYMYARHGRATRLSTDARRNSRKACGLTGMCTCHASHSTATSFCRPTHDCCWVPQPASAPCCPELSPDQLFAPRCLMINGVHPALQEVMALFEQREAAVADSPNQRRQLMELQGIGERPASSGSSSGSGGSSSRPGTDLASAMPALLQHLLPCTLVGPPFCSAAAAAAAAARLAWLQVSCCASALPPLQCCFILTWPPSMTWSWGRCATNLHRNAHALRPAARPGWLSVQWTTNWSSCLQAFTGFWCPGTLLTCLCPSSCMRFPELLRVSCVPHFRRPGCASCAAKCHLASPPSPWPSASHLRASSASSSPSQVGSCTHT